MADGQAIKVDVVGLKELQKALRQADPDLAKDLQRGQKQLAEDLVEAAQGRAAERGPAAAKAAEGLKAKGEQRYSKIILDGKKYPTLFGEEFGALQYKQFPMWRGNQYTDPLGQDVGYFLHPELRDQRDHIVGFYDDLVGDLLERIARY